MIPVEYDISVKDLATFVHRSGDLGGDGGFRRANRALEGIKGHKRIQQSRGSDYRPEVPVELSIIRGRIKLRLVGRVDGIVEGLTPLVEEIKTVETGWSRQPAPVHWAQLRLYAGILASEKGWPQASLQLTYLELDTNEIFIFREEASKEVLIKFLEETLDHWFSWLEPHVAWLEQRNASAEKAPFPFTSFRTGQRELAKSVYRAVQNRLNLRFATLKVEVTYRTKASGMSWKDVVKDGLFLFRCMSQLAPIPIVPLLTTLRPYR